MYNYIFISIIIGYLLGSIPNALIIGKAFYNIDVRNYGSKNLGGSNTGRVLGKKAGLIVMILDVLKVIIAFFLTSFFPYSEITTIWAGTLATIGHCYPIFANFKGGKAVSTMYGFLMGTMIFSLHDPWVFFIPLILFLITLYLTKIVSVSSILSSITSTIYIFITVNNIYINLASLLITILLIYRHSTNIERVIKGTENKITWM